MSYVNATTGQVLCTRDYWCDCDRCGTRSQRQRQKFKAIEYTRRRRMYGHMSDIEKLRRALLNAAFHAKTVINRTVVSERKHRTGEFVTSLRRELRDMGLTSVYAYLCEKDNWNDILDTNSNVTKKVEDVISSVRREMMNQDSPKYIELGLNQVDKQIGHAMSLLRDIDKINDEADEVLNEFKELATNMQD